jgi:ribulose bisphosphate carboxylase small subunit
MENKQTAVDYLVEQLFKIRNNTTEVKEININSIIAQAKQMEKEQEAEIFKEAQICAVKHDGVYFKYESIEDYYKSKEVEVESSDNSKGQEYQHALTWVNALKYAIEKMKGLDNSESEDAFRKYYNEKFGGDDE